MSFYDVKLAMHDDVKTAMSQFAPNFLSYVPAKYCLNWFTAGKVIAKIKR